MKLVPRLQNTTILSVILSHVFSRYIANFISYLKLLAIALIVTGQNPFQMFGMNTPRLWSWGQENKVMFVCLSFNINGC